jgi:glycosyltransferase involved in cell wall biosynthesis
MQVLKFHDRNPKVSIILLDWGVRESFHSLDYLNRQTTPRDDYELLWIEFYDHVPDGLHKKVATLEHAGLPGLDQWIVIGAPRDVLFHKHFAYNVGIALAQGDICVICDSDAMFPEDFVQRTIDEFHRQQRIVLHMDQIRNFNPRFYPFNGPTIDEVLADRLNLNWDGSITKGLHDDADMLHDANYGACMAAWRHDLLSIGGADEHIDYLGYVCGPYELTFRLINHGCKEVWLRDLFLVHTWHPGEGGDGNLAGPDDGRGISLRALEARSTGRVMSNTENPVIHAMRIGAITTRKRIIDALSEANLALWHKDSPHLRRIIRPKLIHEGIGRYNVVQFGDVYYAVPIDDGPFFAESAQSGGYRHLMQDTDCDRLIATLTAKVVKYTPSFGERPRLLHEGIRGFNVVGFRDLYYALPQSLGPISIEDVAAGKYTNVLTDPDKEELIRRLPKEGFLVRSQRRARSLARRLLAASPLA